MPALIGAIKEGTVGEARVSLTPEVAGKLLPWEPA